MLERSSPVPPFRTEVFHSYGEFEQYLRDSDALRSSRWLYERSLASSADMVELSGTCALCLAPARFAALTRGGEPVPGGKVPNWREGLACDCEHQLINRERALLHFLLAEGLVQPWVRTLGLGELDTLESILKGTTGHLDRWPGSLDIALTQDGPPRRGYHLLISIEQFERRLAQPPTLAALASLLAPGGSLVFTAPFEIAPPTGASALEGPIGWEILDALHENGFTAARACTYWSEELGYLGPFSFIVAAEKE